VNEIPVAAIRERLAQIDLGPEVKEIRLWKSAK